MQVHQSQSVNETMDIAETLSASAEPGQIIALYGDLGAGKTHFVKGFARGLHIRSDQVQSPTFTIINEYDGHIPLYHFDFYRIEQESDALEIGFEEYLYGEGVCIIEWPERIKGLLPETHLVISIESIDSGKRKITIH